MRPPYQHQVCRELAILFLLLEVQGTGHYKQCNISGKLDRMVDNHSEGAKNHSEGTNFRESSFALVGLHFEGIMLQGLDAFVINFFESPSNCSSSEQYGVGEVLLGDVIGLDC